MIFKYVLKDLQDFVNTGSIKMYKNLTYARRLVRVVPSRASGVP